MGLLDKSVPVDFQGEVFDPGRRPTMEGGIDQWLQHMPDLAPARADRLPQRPRVLRAEHWAVGIVVDRDVLGAPPQKQRKTVGEQKTHHHAEARGPGGDRANRRLRPVECTYHRAHLSAAAEPMLHGRVCLYVGVVWHALPSIAMRTSVPTVLLGWQWCSLRGPVKRQGKSRALALDVLHHQLSAMCGHNLSYAIPFLKVTVALVQSEYPPRSKIAKLMASQPAVHPVR